MARCLCQRGIMRVGAQGHAPGTWLALEAPPRDRGYCVLRRCTRASAYATRCRSAIGRLVTFPVLARLRPPPMATNVTLGYASRWRRWGVALWPWLAHVRPTQESSSSFHLRARYAFPRSGDAVPVFDGSSCTSSPRAIVGAGGHGFSTTHTRRGNTPPSRVLGPPLCSRMSWMAYQRPPAPRYGWHRRAWVLDDALEARPSRVLAPLCAAVCLGWLASGHLPRAIAGAGGHGFLTTRPRGGITPPSRGLGPPLCSRMSWMACQRPPAATFGPLFIHFTRRVELAPTSHCHVRCGAMPAQRAARTCGAAPSLDGPGQHGMPTRGGDHRQRGSSQCDGVSPSRPWTPSRPIGPRASARSAQPVVGCAITGSDSHIWTVGCVRILVGRAGSAHENARRLLVPETR